MFSHTARIHPSGVLGEVRMIRLDVAPKSGSGLGSLFDVPCGLTSARGTPYPPSPTLRTPVIADTLKAVPCPRGCRTMGMKGLSGTPCK